MKVFKIFGPPGTGKTTEALRQLEIVLKDTDPRRIAFITFTRKARHEALQRILDIYPNIESPYIRTIHALCYKELNLNEDRIVSAKTMAEYTKQTDIKIDDTMSLDDDVPLGSDGSKSEGQQILNWYHIERTRRVPIDYSALCGTDHGLISPQQVKSTLEFYEHFKKANGLLDFTDFLSEYLAYGTPLDVDYLFVDEAQDLSELQWCVVDKLSGTAGARWEFGDDDQAIFTFAGANALAMMNRKATHERVLSHSYRLPRKILELATRVIQRVHERRPKDFEHRGAEGSVRRIHEINPDEINLTSSLILYRHHYVAKKFMDDLKNEGIPYMAHGSVYKDPAKLQYIHTFFELKHHKYVKFDLVYHMLRASNRGMWPHYKELMSLRVAYIGYDHKFFKGAPWDIPWQDVFPDIRRQDEIQKIITRCGYGALAEKPGVNLSSIHQSKGGEADQVILLPDMSVKSYRSMDEHQLPDEHRVFYVGITRAREELLLHTPDTHRYYEF